jgi:hypothetical protein
MSTIDDGGPAIEVPLLRNGVLAGFALVSACDAERVLACRWRMTVQGYVQSCGANARSELLHRFVLNAKKGIEIHHKNEVKTDCRRLNLEEVTPKDHQLRHSHIVTARNFAARIYPLTGTCKHCGSLFVSHPAHRGRQTCCSKRCACLVAVVARKAKFHENLMLAERARRQGKG